MTARLNLGCGADRKEGWINVDYNRAYNPDVVHDFDCRPYPFEAEQFDRIYCSHVLEHVEDLFGTLDELLRILKRDGVIHVRVPHFSNGNGYNDLTHRRFFGWYTFRQMVDGYYNRPFGFRIAKQRFNFLAERHVVANVAFSWIFNIMPKQVYERFLCWVVPVGEIELELRRT
jgi:ubiquinone/menaquinone biosynthesis C-methylase UbiE